MTGLERWLQSRGADRAHAGVSRRPGARAKPSSRCWRTPAPAGARCTPRGRTPAQMRAAQGGDLRATLAADIARAGAPRGRCATRYMTSGSLRGSTTRGWHRSRPTTTACRVSGGCSRRRAEICTRFYAAVRAAGEVPRAAAARAAVRQRSGTGRRSRAIERTRRRSSARVLVPAQRLELCLRVASPR